MSAKLANKAYAYLLITPINATDTVIKAYTHLFTISTNATKADLFVYSITTELYYTFIVFIKIMINISTSKKFTVNYKQF
jgi:hypothetical protein